MLTETSPHHPVPLFVTNAPSRILCPWDFPGKSWSGLPFSSPGDLPDPGIEPESPALQVYCLPLRPLGVVLCVSRSVVYYSLWPHGLYSLPGFSLHGIFLVRILEWVAIFFSRGSSWPRDRSRVSFIASGLFTVWATRESPMLYIERT